MRGGRMRNLISYAAVVVSAGVFASVPVVTGISQDGKRNAVITYTLEQLPAIVTLAIETNTLANGAGDWVDIGGENVQTVSGDVNRIVRRSADEYTIKWHARRDWPDQEITGTRTRAVVTVWPTNAPPRWMVVGLDVNEDVRFYAASNYVPGGVASDLYKTNSLLMRRIDAAGVVWNMGTSKDTDGNHHDPVSEQLHRVCLTENFYIGVYEVTQGQYPGISGTKSVPGSFKNYEDSPFRPCGATTMSLLRGMSQDFKSYVWPQDRHDVTPDSVIGHLRQKTGNVTDFDLPTEAQWEFACRAGTDTAFNNGTGIGADNYKKVGWFTSNSKENTTDSKAQTHPVGLKIPNGWGLYDMHGNVQERCLDRASNGSEYESTFNRDWWRGGVTVDPVGAEIGVFTSDKLQTIIRGGSYSHAFDVGRSGDRGSGGSLNAGAYNGFRLVCPAVFR